MLAVAQFPDRGGLPVQILVIHRQPRGRHAFHLCITVDPVPVPIGVQPFAQADFHVYRQSDRHSPRLQGAPAAQYVARTIGTAVLIVHEPVVVRVGAGRRGDRAPKRRKPAVDDGDALSSRRGTAPPDGRARFLGTAIVGIRQPVVIRVVAEGRQFSPSQAGQRAKQAIRPVGHRELWVISCNRAAVVFTPGPEGTIVLVVHVPVAVLIVGVHQRTARIFLRPGHVAALVLVIEHTVVVPVVALAGASQAAAGTGLIVALVLVVGHAVAVLVACPRVGRTLGFEWAGLVGGGVHIVRQPVSISVGRLRTPLMFTQAKLVGTAVLGIGDAIPVPVGCACRWTALGGDETCFVGAGILFIRDPISISIGGLEGLDADGGVGRAAGAGVGPGG